MKATLRTIFWLLALTPIGVFYGLIPQIAASSIPGAELFLCLFAAYAIGAVIVPLLIIWWWGRKKRIFGKKSLVFAIVLLLLPLLPAVPYIPLIIELEKERNAVIGQLNKTTVNDVKESYIVLGENPIGLQLDIDMNLPSDLVEQPAKFSNTSFCKAIPSHKDTSFQAYFSGDNQKMTTL